MPLSVSQGKPATSISQYESPRKLAKEFVGEFSQKTAGSGVHQIELRYVVPQSDTRAVREAIQKEFNSNPAIHELHDVTMRDQPAVNGFGWSHVVITVTAEV
jgi:hypothetical protein